MTEKIVIAGASGFIGSYLTAAYRAGGSEVVHIGRAGDAVWGDSAAIAALVDGSALLINLAGKSVNCRYTPANRAEIMRSRIETTRELGRAVAASTTPPKLWLNSSTATIYRHADDRPMTESSGEIGSGFSVGVATAWEREFFGAVTPDTRKVALRMAIVLGDGSALIPLLRLARFGLGGAQLDGPWFSTQDRRESGVFHEYRATHGHQKFSWIHIADVLGAITFLRDHEEIDGPVNLSSPEPRDNTSLMATIRRRLGIPFSIPAPRPLLELGTAIIRSETELVLKSRWVLPETLEASGYQFRYPQLESAIDQILESR